MRTTLGSLLSSDRASEEAAAILGANAPTVFRRVTLPLIAPGVVAGAVMAFLISFDEAVISLFLVGSGSPTLPVAMLEYVQNTADPQVAAVSVVVIGFSLIVMAVVDRTVGVMKAVQ
jgi:putative spermidine/putrescine transport system permease protein